jgi:hypothetical protein
MFSPRFNTRLVEEKLRGVLVGGRLIDVALRVCRRIRPLPSSQKANGCRFRKILFPFISLFSKQIFAICEPVSFNRYQSRCCRIV